MPLVEIINTASGQIGIWKIDGTEESQFVNIYGREPEELMVMHRKTSEQRIASRVLLSEMIGRPIDLIKDEHGKPHLPDDARHVSISHTVGFASVMIGNKAAVDVQEFRPKIVRMADRFLDANERSMAPDVERTTLLWAAKEVLYKYNGKPGLDFRDPITIHEIHPSYLETSFIYENQIHHLELSWKMLDGAALVWLS
ncbi:MAG: 4'-phosphopantetheinyl transferase [Granulosicoccus sp.]|jgi:4'-phosphopantetheinyl transferase